MRGLLDSAYVDVYSDGQRLGTVVERAHRDVNGQISSVAVGPPECPTCRIFDSRGIELAAVMKQRHWVSAWYTLVRGERSVGVLERVAHLAWRISVCEAAALDTRLLVFLAASQVVAEVQQSRAARDG